MPALPNRERQRRAQHPGWPPRNDEPLSWTEGYEYLCPECDTTYPGLQRHDGQENGAHSCIEQVPNCSFSPPGCFGFSVCVANTSKDEADYSRQLEDQRITDRSIALLRNASAAATRATFPNFFVGVGLHKPHVPWLVPREFMERLPPAEQIPLAVNVHAPTGMPPCAWHPPADVHGMGGQGFNGTSPPLLSRQYRRAYAASVSYQDYNIGRILSALKEVGAEDSTIVSLMGDHVSSTDLSAARAPAESLACLQGWQLGDHATWAKMVNFEIGLHVPLIIRAPGL